jgi:hypothetical protein
LTGFGGRIVGASWDVTISKSSKQFSGTVQGGVRGEQIGKEVEATGFEIAGSMSGWSRRKRDNSITLAERPRVRATKAVDDAGGADMVAWVRDTWG